MAGQRVFSSEDRILVNHLKNILDSENIRCEVRNEILSGGAGELAPIDTWPELWVLDALKLDYSKQLIREALKELEQQLPDWQCPSCGANVPGSLALCWQCGTRYQR